MSGDANSVRCSIDVSASAEDCFRVFVDELESALSSAGIRFEISGDREEQVRQATIEWHPARWRSDVVTRIDLRAEPVNGGTRVTIEHQGWGRLLKDPSERIGWFAREIAAPFVVASTSEHFGDWLTDRLARRPSGAASRANYREPLYHLPSFRVLLEELTPGAGDFLLDVGCGGGAFIHQALRGGCRATGLDHSVEMLRVARELNRDSISEHRLDVIQADASRLPLASETYTCASLHGVLGFLPDPVAALSEIRRVLRTSGRLFCLGADPELKGTPACPEPIGSRLSFFDDDALLHLGQAAGFDQITVMHRNLEQYAREAGIPEAHLSLFANREARFLSARKSG